MVTIADLSHNKQQVTVTTIGQQAERISYTGTIADFNEEWIQLQHADGHEWLIPISAIASVLIHKPQY